MLEIGCGCGSALLPVLKANPTCRVTATDVSQTAVGMLSAAAQRLGIAPDRIQAFVADAAAPASSPLNGTDQAIVPMQHRKCVLGNTGVCSSRRR